MSSAINPSFPVPISPTTSSVRDNFQHSKDEIEALQAADAAEATARTNADAALQAQITGLGTPVQETSGVWTPVLTFATPGNLAVAYSKQVGRWQRHANRMFITAQIQTSTFTWTTAAGALIINGLPVAAKNITDMLQVIPAQYQGWNHAGYTDLTFRATPGSTTLQSVISGPGMGLNNAVAADFPSGTVQVFVISGNYEI